MLNALPCLAVLPAAALILLVSTWCSYRPQRAGGGEGALTVQQLIEQVEAERRQRERTGRHRLREPDPPSPQPPSTPSPEVQRRSFQALKNL